MSAIKLKLWRSASLVLALGAAACQPPDPATPAPPEAAAGGGEAGESAIGEAGGEHGEAGVAEAYAGLEGPARRAMRLQHLKGFVLIARSIAEAGGSEAAGALVGQGMLEVYDTAPDQFGGFDAAPMRAAAEIGGRPRADALRALDAAERSIDEAQRAAPAANQAEIARRMVGIATGLYGHVVQADFVDPIEYQHSLGAALAAREALVNGERDLRARNARAYQEALAEVDRLIALWPGPNAPERPTPNAQVLGQAARVELALSPLL